MTILQLERKKNIFRIGVEKIQEFLFYAFYVSRINKLLIICLFIKSDKETCEHTSTKLLNIAFFNPQLPLSEFLCLFEIFSQLINLFIDGDIPKRSHYSAFLSGTSTAYLSFYQTPFLSLSRILLSWSNYQKHGQSPIKNWHALVPTIGESNKWKWHYEKNSDWSFWEKVWRKN